VGVVVAVGLGVLACVSTHSRDARLDDASATQHRLAIGGPDDNLVLHLITLQLDETQLFQAHVETADAASAETGDPAFAQTGDPRQDVSRVEADLAAVRGQSSSSAQMESDVGLINRELPIYADLEATAKADNQQGLPVGAAYLRDAAEYLRTNILPRADDIRTVDQARLAADDTAATGEPIYLMVADGLGIAYLVTLQIVLARRSRRVWNAGVLAATVTIVALTSWSLTNTLVSRNQFATRAVPHAHAAADLARARDDTLRTRLDDELSLADHGEDCSTTTTAVAQRVYEYSLTCTYEQEALAILGAPNGPIVTEFDQALHDTADVRTHAKLVEAQRLEELWLGVEHKLPTLQNLTASAGGATAAGNTDVRFSADFDANVLNDYSQYYTTLTIVATKCATDAFFVQGYIQDATGLEWDGYSAAVAKAKHTLGGLVSGGLLLGLLAGVAVGAGVGRRAAEYWFTGRSGA
jgi:hypothetical protein